MFGVRIVFLKKLKQNLITHDRKSDSKCIYKYAKFSFASHE